jgi:hypothetical protein
MTKQILISLFFLLNIFFLGAINAEACSCMMMSSCEAYARAKIVFTGKIIKAEKVDAAIRHQVQVEENFLGMDNVSLIDVYTDNASSCMFSMDAGKDYLIYASRSGESGQIWTGMCSRTAQIDEAEEDLKYLRSIQNSGKVGGTIKGKVLDENSTDEKPQKPEQVDKVFIESKDGEKFEADIEADGKYEISGLKAGQYNIFVTPPKGYATNYETDPFSDDSDAARFTEVSGQGCTIKNFEVRINGVISGKVFDADGLPVKERRVNLFRLPDPNKVKAQPGPDRQTETSEDDSEEVDSTQAANEIEESSEEEYEADFDDYTNEDGSFSFSGLPPGRYLLGFEIDKYLSIQGDQDQYVPAYFPGTKKKETAVIIDLKKSQILTDRNIQLFPKLKKRKIAGQIVWKNGKSEPKAKVEYYAKREGNPASDWIGSLDVDAKGNFKFDGYEETEYLIKAQFDKPLSQDSSEVTHSSKCFVVPKTGIVKPIKLVLEIGGANCDETEFSDR